MKRQAQQPVLITDAARSQDDQLHSRQVRYLAMMGIRAACLIIGAVLVSAKVPMLWLWLPLCGVGMVLVPWLAVLIANDRPPRERRRRAARAGRAARRDQQELPAVAPTGRTIDAEP